MESETPSRAERKRQEVTRSKEETATRVWRSKCFTQKEWAN